jgi:beta-barrel assembly-enhancing protease
MRILVRLPTIWLATALAVPFTVSAGGNYESLPIRESEQDLIDTANDLEGYFAAHGLLYRDEQIVSLVRRVGHELRPQPTDDYIEYEFFVLRDPSPNAFALPNGHVYVHTGMLARLRDEDQLAALLAHEINHVAGHHGIVDHRATKKASIAGMVLGGATVWGGMIAVGLQASVFGFSRDLEQEADDRAAIVLRDSRYDPHALPELLDILGHDYDGLDPRVPTIWSTHPEIRARADMSRALVADMPRRERQMDAFEVAVYGLRTMTVQDYVQDDYPQTALALAESLSDRYPKDPRMLQLLGDAWQAMGAQRRLDPAQLTNSDKRQNRKDRARKTREQRLAEQLATDDGRAAYAENLTRAEETYKRVLAADPSFAAGHRGLGEVYEQQQRDREAAQEYVTYVRSAPDAADRPIVVGRLKALTVKLKESSSDRS